MDVETEIFIHAHADTDTHTLDRCVCVCARVPERREEDTVCVCARVPERREEDTERTTALSNQHPLAVAAYLPHPGPQPHLRERARRLMCTYMRASLRLCYPIRWLYVHMHACVSASMLSDLSHPGLSRPKAPHLCER